MAKRNGLEPKHNIEWTLRLLKQDFGYKFEKEYQALKPRKFRFDWAIPELQVAIEYEGLFSKKSQSNPDGKSRHTSYAGYTDDCEKYNLAAISGWIVLRYTAINYKNLSEDLEKILGERL